MLRWVGKKYMEMQKVREENRKNGEMGFTLIELLVVVIIIGILAAIAIPAFLNQRENAWQAQTTSDVRNAVTNAESYATTNGGLYTGMELGDVTSGLENANSTFALGTIAADDFCVQGTNTSATGDPIVFSYTKSADNIVPEACPA